jgi:hypothetical protein
MVNILEAYKKVTGGANAIKNAVWNQKVEQKQENPAQTENPFTALLPKKANAQTVDNTKKFTTEDLKKEAEKRGVKTKEEFDALALEMGLTKKKSQPKSMLEVMTQDKKATGAEPIPPARPDTMNPLQAFGKNLWEAPGKLAGEVGDAFSGKTAGKINKLNQQLADEEKAKGTDKSGDWGAELNQVLAGAAGATASMIPNAAAYVGDALYKPIGDAQKTVATAFGKTPEEVEQAGKNPVSEGLRNFGDAFQGAVESTGTLETGIPKESVSGNIGRIASLILGTGKLSGGLSKFVDEAVKVGGSAEKLMGSIARGEKLIKAEGGVGYGARTAEKVANALESTVRGWLKSSGKAAVETELFTGLSEGRKAKGEELMTGILLGNTLDAFGGIFKDYGAKAFNKAIDLFRGKGKEEGFNQFVARKLYTAIDEGFTGGTDPLSYRKLADEKIASYSAAVDNFLNQNNIRIDSKEFFDNVGKKIDDLERSGLFQKAKTMKEELGRLTGSGSTQEVGYLTKEINNLKNSIESFTKNRAKKIAEGEAKNKTLSTAFEDEAIATKTLNLEKKQNQLAEIMRITELGKENMENLDLEALRNWKRIAAEKNKGVVSGKTATDAQSEAKNELWMLVRDEAEDYLNKVAPGLKDVNNRLNVAYRVLDVLDALEFGGALKQGTRRAEAAFDLGNLLQGTAAKTGARMGVQGNEQAENTVDAVKSGIPNVIQGGADLGAKGINAAGQGVSGLAGLFQ